MFVSCFLRMSAGRHGFQELLAKLEGLPVLTDDWIMIRNPKNDQQLFQNIVSLKNPKISKQKQQELWMEQWNQVKEGLICLILWLT